MSSTLNILCAICSEFYKPNDVIYSTTLCGHLFHYNCLNRWIQMNRTCPQCRRSCHRSRIHRVFLNFGEPTDDDDIELDNYNTLIWVPLGDQSDKDLKVAIKSGTDEDGNDAYVARAYHEEDLLPANYVPKKNGAYAPYNTGAHLLREDVEILIDCDCKWVADSNGHVPEDAIVTGYSATGENLYTGRANYKGLILPGKVHPSHRVLYMPYKGHEENVKNYEVLVKIKKIEEAKKE